MTVASGTKPFPAERHGEDIDLPGTARPVHFWTAWFSPPAGKDDLLDQQTVR